MSVVTGKPVRVLTVSKVRSPASSPGPRNDLLEVRFALSKDALNTNGKAKRSANSRSRPAIFNVRSCVSITQGPAIHKSGWPRPQLSVPMETVRTDSMIYPRWSEFSGVRKDRTVSCKPPLKYHCIKVTSAKSVEAKSLLAQPSDRAHIVL